eukprot:CAMPEP_0179176426 /NCGR_PEP_ID=MMETSP0796-20121207/87231_1 /TAXON_ID=73915 /ORGANISM="Pyrodinium bahamense, Strain pbaha01" /LENGTH=196 /DNA_ID=CAMNT_0020879951 /DNA_START=55 /DNA_END=642 /DNA_ORIENTATION=+
MTGSDIRLRCAATSPSDPSSLRSRASELQGELVFPRFPGGGFRVDLSPQLLRQVEPVRALQVDDPNFKGVGAQPDADPAGGDAVHAGQGHVHGDTALVLLVDKGHVPDLGPVGDGADPLLLLAVGLREAALVQVLLLAVKTAALAPQRAGRARGHGHHLAALADLSVLGLQPDCLLQVLVGTARIAELQPRLATPV